MVEVWLQFKQAIHLKNSNGIILLGSYSTANLGNKPVLSIYGSEDKILNQEKYSKYKNNINSNLEELIIPGGNHAFFGTYGFQKNDGFAKISNKEQITITAQTISNFIFK